MEQRRAVQDVPGLLRQLERCFAAGTAMPLEITGSSMTPFLAPGRDRVLLSPVEGTLARGDIALFQRRSGALVLHRVAACRPEGYYFIGDDQTQLEGPIAPEQLRAVARQAVRKSKRQGPGCFWWWFFRRVWLWLRPVRPALRRLYGALRPRRANQL